MFLSDKKKYELREWGRYEVQVRAKITIPNEGNAIWYGQTLDISKGGLRIFVPRELEKNAIVIMEFSLPYSWKNIEIRGVVRNRNSFTYGVEFVEPTSHQQQIIFRVCKTLELLQ